MLSPIFSMAAWWRRRVPAPCPAAFPQQEAWLRDRLSHPDIAAMDLRQIADLPPAELREEACS